LQTTAAQEAAATAAESAREAARIYKEASEAASAKQIEYGNLAIGEQQRQFTEMQKIMQPWVEQGTEAMGRLGQYEAAGTDALGRQRALMGLDGQDAQRAAIEGISQSPEMLAMIGQGEDALRQQGAATGGLRGGNTQAALAQFRPSMLSQLINQQYSKLGGLVDMGQGITMNKASLGQASAAGVGGAGMQSGANIANLLAQQGQAAGQGILGAGQAAAQGELGAGQAASGGQMSVAQAAAAGLLGAGQSRSQGQFGAGQYSSQGILGAGQANAQGIYNSGMAQANQQMAAGQAWSQVPNYFTQGAMLGYGLKNPGAF
jgi:hypothetical protein